MHVLRGIRRPSATVALLLATGACSSYAAVDPDAHGVVLVARPDRATLAQGDTLRVATTLRHVDGSAVALHGSSSCKFGLRVRDSAGDAFSVTRICTMDLRILRLGGGDSTAEMLNWTGRRSESDVAASGTGRVAPGEYTLTAVTTVWVCRIEEVDPPASCARRVESAPFKVTVVAADPRRP